jgi:predicted TIM-barrel fold metal-dependent hydrolase
MLATYPNLNVDLATTPAFLHPVGRENLRDFMVEYADRILFGTDAPGGRYKRYFDFLETDKVLPSGVKGEHKVRGLALPVEVLEKIYFRNAMRIYPRVKDVLKKLGYLAEK